MAYWLLKTEPSEWSWNDQVKAGALDPATIPHDRTIGYQIDRYVSVDKSRLDAGDLSVSEFDTIRRCAHYFGEWVGSDLSADVIDEEKILSYWQYLVKIGVKPGYKKLLTV